MDLFELDVFVDELKKSKDLLLEMEINRDRLAVVGMKQIGKWEGFEEAAASLTNLEKGLSQAIRISRFIDPELHDRLENVYQNSPLVSRAAEIGVAVQIAETRANIRNTSYIGTGLFGLADEIVQSFSRILGVKVFKSYFSDEGEIPVRRMLVDVERLIPLTEELSRLAWRASFSDDETFKPSNISIEEVNIFVNQAMVAIDASTHINSGTKEKLEEYLSAVKAELVNDTPAWKNIVGALVIVSAILGGIAVAPVAYQNINDAIQHILGTSIDQITPNGDSGPNFLPNPIEV